MVGVSSRRKAGSLAMFCSRAFERSAVAWLVILACVTKLATLARSRASGARITSLSRARLASVRFWSARIRRTLSVSLSAGSAFLIARRRSPPRPARPVPSSLMMMVRRSR